MNPKNEPNSELKAARDLIRQRKYTEAAEFLQQKHVADPRDEDTLELLAMSYFYGGQLEDARDTFEQLTKLNAGHTKAWVNLGAILNRMGEYKRAVEVLRRALHKDRKCAEAYYNMGIGQRGLNLNTMAISAYKEAIRLKPDLIEAHLNLGNIYLDMKNTGLAVQCFQAALKQDPNSRKAKSSLEKATASQKSARKTASPFGRLVDVDSLNQQEQASGPRILESAAREDERELVQKVTKAVRSATKELVPILGEPLHDHLHRVQRLILQSESRLSSAEHFDVFSGTINEIQRLKKIVTEELREIRQHLKS